MVRMVVMDILKINSMDRYGITVQHWQLSRLFSCNPPFYFCFAFYKHCACLDVSVVAHSFLPLGLVRLALI